MSIPTVTVEVGFGSTWKTADADITWTDLTSRTIAEAGCTVFRGATSAHGRSGAGTFDVTFDNADRELDPLHSAGTYYGDLVPGVPIRITATANDTIALDSDGRPVLDGNDEYTVTGDTGVLDESGSAILDEAGEEIGGTSVTVGVVRGFVTGWPQRSIDGNTMTTVTVPCVDGFQQLARASLPRSVFAQTLEDLGFDHHWPLSDASGATGAVDVLGSVHGSAFNDPEFGQRALLPGLESACEFDGDRIDVSRSPLDVDEFHCTVVAIVRTTTAGDSDTSRPVFSIHDGKGIGEDDTLVLYVDEDGAAVFAYTDDGVGYAFASPVITDGDTHLLIAQSNVGSGSNYGVAVDTATLSTSSTIGAYQGGNGTGIGGTPFAARGFTDNLFVGRISNVALKDDVLTLAQRQTLVTALDAWDGDTTGARLGRILDHIGWPADLREVDTGKSALGAATFDGDSALRYMQLIESTEDGRLFIDRDGSVTFRHRHWPFIEDFGSTSQFTFTDDLAGPNNDNGYAEFNWELDDELVVNSASFSRRDGGVVRVEDTTSQDLYGRRELVESDLLLATDAQVRGRAEWTILTRKDALPRVERIVAPLHAYHASVQLAALTLDLGHRVTCERTPQGVGSEISREFIVDGIRHRIEAHEWWMELYVSPAPDQDLTLFTLDTSTLDGTHVLAF